MIAAFLFGVIMGFVSAIPVAGPVSAMVIERTLDQRYMAALMVAIGTAIAEGIYAGVAVLGFSALAELPWVAPASKGLAAVVLIVVGLLFALRKPKGARPVEASPEPRREGQFGQLAIGFSVTIVNPTLLAAWAAGTSMVVASGWVSLEPITAIPFGLAVVVGVTAWFALVIVMVKRFTKDLAPSSVSRVIRVIGWLLVGLGLWFVVLFVRAL